MIKTIETRLIPYTARTAELMIPDFGGEAMETPEELQTRLRAKKRKLVDGQGIKQTLAAKKDTDIRGHTAFLTFASKFFI